MIWDMYTLQGNLNVTAAWRILKGNGVLINNDFALCERRVPKAVQRWQVG